MSLDIIRRLAADYLAGRDGHTTDAARLDAIMRAAADLPLADLRALARGLGARERQSYLHSSVPEGTARLTDLRRCLKQRRASQEACEHGR